MAIGPRSHDQFQFSRCAVAAGGRVWFLAQDGDTYRVLQLFEGSWRQKSLPWDAVAICGRTKPFVESFVVGANGECLRGTQQGFSLEQIDQVNDRPGRVGIVRDARVVGELVFVAGMARQVHRRADDGTWDDISLTIAPPKSPKFGFNSIDGFSGTDLIAVGLGGEIWCFRDNRWNQLNSPTNVSLNRVQVTTGGIAYACGQTGVFVELSGESGRVLAAGSTKQNLYGLAHFKKGLFVSSQKSLFKLSDDELVPIDMGLGEEATTGFLDTDGETLWSVGVHHIACSKDGENWTLVTCAL